MQVNVAFNSIGFTAALIVNRLRNELQIADDNETNEQRRAEEDHKEETERARLKFVRQRLADLAAFEDRASGRPDKKRRGGS